MTDKVIKQVPNILENPIIVMRSQNVSTRFTMFGEVYVNEKPVLAVLELKPTDRNGLFLDEIKIASAYGKDRAQNFINNSEVLYVEKDKKRVSEWEKRTRLQLPVGIFRANSISSVSISSENVKSATDNIGTYDGNNPNIRRSRREGDGFIRTYNQRDKVTNSLEKRLNEKYSYKNLHYVDGIPVTFDSIHKSNGMGSLATFYVNMTIGDESDNAESFTIRYSGHESRYGDYDRSIQNKDIKSLDDLYNAVDEVIADYVNELPDWQREELRNEFAEQAKNTTTKFSLRSPVEQTKDLIAVHNMTKEELLKSLKLGGLPMPSIAIIKATTGHSEYGDVSLVFNKDTIDPKKSAANKVYGGDAWTPTYPKVELKPNGNIKDKIRDKYYELAEKVGYENAKPLYDYVSDVESKLSHAGSETELLQNIYKDTDMMQLYRQDAGAERVNEVYKESVKELGEGEVELNDFLINELGKDVVEAIRAPKGESPLKHRVEYFNKYGEQIKDAYGKYFKEIIGFTDADVADILSDETAGSLTKLIRNAREYLENGKTTITKEFDSEATKAAIMEQTDQEAYKAWVDDLFKGIVEKEGIYNGKDPYTSSGNRRSFEATHWENNLENVVRAMKQETETGGGTLFGASAMWGVTAKQYNSIEEIKADSDRLKHIDEADYEKIKNDLGDRFSEIASSIVDTEESNQFIALDNAMSNIVEAIRSSKTKSGIYNYLKQYQKNVTETTVNDIVDLVSDMANMPTGYFEAKPRRAVEFNEVAYAIVPNDISSELRTALTDSNVDFVEYLSGDENDRLEKLNADSSVRFSRRDYSYEALIKKPDMKITTVDDKKSYHTQTTRKDIVNRALKNAVQFGSQNENGNVVINVDDIGTDVILSKNGLRHGLDTRLDELAPITLKAGEILKNSIRINELLPRKEYISNTYVLIGAAKDSSNNPYVVDFVVNKATNEVTSVDVLYSINKKEPTGTKSPSGYASIAPYFTGSEISISKLLDAVNLTFPDILPEDVLRHYDYTERPEGSLGNSAMFSCRDYSFSKALTSAEWKKYNNSIMTGVDAGLRINENSTLVECEDGDFEYKYVIYDNETEDKNILAVYGLRTNYEKATAREIAEYLYKLEEQGYADERITKKIYNSIGKNYGALLGKYNRENSRFTRTRRWDNSSGEADGKGTSGETVSEGVKHSRRDQYARDLKREFKYTDTVENVSKKLDDIEELQRSATTSSDYQAAYDSAKSLAEDIINNGQVIDDESLAIRKRLKDYLAPLKFYADETLKGEMIYTYGSWAAFQKEMRARGIRFTTKAEPGVFSLDSYWDGIAEEFPGIISQDVNSLEQPVALANVYDAFDGRAELSMIEKSEYIKNITDDIMAETAPTPKFVNRRTGQSFDNRTILVNALESAAKTDAEKNLLRGYKDNISTLVELQDDLAQTKAEIKRLSFAPGKRDMSRITELQKEANRLGIRISQTDRKLLQIEAMDSLKGLLQREKAAAYKKAKEEGKKALQEYREKETERYHELVLKNRAKSKRNIENRHKTELKHKILRQVNKLNSLLLNETKDKHVPITLKPLTASALKAINTQMSSTDAQLEAKLLEIEKTNNPVKKAQLQEQYDRMLLKNESMKERLDALRQAYAEIESSGSSLYDPDIMRKINDVIADVQDTPLRDMSLSQLQSVHDMYSMIQHTISEANKMHKAARNQTVSDTAKKFVEELRPKEWAYKVADKLRTAAYNEDKPIYFFRRLGSETGKQLFGNILETHHVYGQRAQFVKDTTDSIRHKHGWNKWNMNDIHRVKIGNTSVEMTLGELMSVYAYTRRDQAKFHLEKGGITLSDKPFKSGSKAVDKLFNKVHRNPYAYRLTEFDKATLVGELTQAQRDYVVEMQELLSGDIAEWGNEATLELYGVELFKEKNYLPLSTDARYAVKDIKAGENADGIKSYKSKGFTKDLVKNASSPIRVEDFDTVWASHAGEMTMWASSVLAIDDFVRVYSFTDFWDGEKEHPDSVRTSIEGAYGKGATKYIEQLINDMNGSSPRNAGTNPLPNLLSTFKKTAVSASASVIIQQPTAIIRAMAYIDPKYFAHIPKRFGNTYQEIKKYAGVAVIKEIGGYDMGTNRNFVTWLNSKEYDGIKDKSKALIMDANYRDEVLMAGAGKADELGWAMIWNACLDEIAAEQGLTGEELKIAAGKRFDEVVNLTQVYDSVLSRSAYMRDKSDLMKMATSFMGEPTTSFNMMTDAFREMQRGNISPADASRVVGSIFGAQIMAVILKSIVFANRDDDDKDWISKYVEALAGNLSPYGELNPITWLPLTRDFVSVMQGFSIERTDLTPLTDLYDTIQDVLNENKPTQRKIEEVVGATGNLFGIPAKNLLRTVREIINAFEGIVGLATDGLPSGIELKESFEEGYAGEDKKKVERLADAIESGRDEEIERARSYYEPEDDSLSSDEVKKKTNASIRSSLTSKYKEEYQDAWKRNDEKTMREIRNILWKSKAYDSQSEVVEKTSGWIKDLKKE